MEGIVLRSLTVFINSASDELKLSVLISSCSLPFWVKEKASQLKNEIREVEELDSWQPAVCLIRSLLPASGLKNLPRIA